MFRALNERIRLLVSPFEPEGREPVPFVCECALEHCFVPVAISPLEFAAVCVGDSHRLIAPEHQTVGEQVVVETPAYAVVRLAKPGENGWTRGGPAAKPVLHESQVAVGDSPRAANGDTR